MRKRKAIEDEENPKKRRETIVVRGLQDAVDRWGRLPRLDWCTRTIVDRRHQFQPADAMMRTLLASNERKRRTLVFPEHGLVRALTLEELKVFQNLEHVNTEGVPRTRAVKGIGNAAPPGMCCAVGRAIRKLVEEVRGGSPLSGALEMFAGFGGMAWGMHNAGFEHVALLEFDSVACDVLRETGTRTGSWDPAVVHRADVFAFDYRPYVGRVDFICGGPPCQPYSLAGNRKGSDDARDGWAATLNVLKILKPRAFAFENVPAVFYGDQRPRFEALLHKLSDPFAESGEPSPCAWWVRAEVLCSELFGVPQKRRRVFVVGIRIDPGEQPPSEDQSPFEIIRNMKLRPSKAPASRIVDDLDDPTGANMWKAYDVALMEEIALRRC